MAIQKLEIEDFLMRSDGKLVLDVRSPSEYRHAHIPAAHSLPLFTDDERKIVGTAYKQQSRETAIKIGLDFFGPKMRAIVEEVEQLLSQRASAGSAARQEVYVHCWRGGMRSAGVAWLLDLYGFKVFTLAGGYKKYRQRAVATFHMPFNFSILGGYTGSGKTYVLDAIGKRGQSVINLETLASHKGSAFGNIGMPDQPSQEMFENLLSDELRRAMNKPGPVWLEDESQRIGLVNIPQPLWLTMRASPIVFLEIPFEERLKHITAEYGSLDKQRMADAIERIRKRLGGLEAKTALQHLENEEIEDCFRVLLKYYDKWYAKGLSNRDNLPSLLRNLPCATVAPSAIAEEICSKELSKK